MEPPRVVKNDGRDLAFEDGAEDCASDRWRRISLLEQAGREAGPLEHEQSDHEDRDQPENHITVQRDVHPRRPEEDPPDQSNGNRGEHEHRKDVDRPCEECAPRAGDSETGDSAHEKIDRADRDHEEAPKDECVGDAAHVIRALQELALTQIDHELVAEPAPRVIDPALVAAEAHVAVKTPRAPKERTESQEGKKEQDRATRIEPAGRRDQQLIPSRSLPR